MLSYRVNSCQARKWKRILPANIANGGRSPARDRLLCSSRYNLGKEINMAPSSKQLTNNGQTTNFQVQYEDTLPNQANVIANANALLAVVENEFSVTTGWFNT